MRAPRVSADFATRALSDAGAIATGRVDRSSLGRAMAGNGVSAPKKFRERLFVANGVEENRPRVDRKSRKTRAVQGAKSEVQRHTSEAKSAMPVISSRRPYRVGRSRTGLGLFATKEIAKGTTIIRYWGPKISSKRADEMENKYLFEINSRWTVDGSIRRNIARYINHACKPNAESDVIGHKIIIRAIKVIRSGDEITYDYGKNYFNTFIKPIGCLCGACEAKRKEERAAARVRAKRAKARALRKAALMKEAASADSGRKPRATPARGAKSPVATRTKSPAKAGGKSGAKPRVKRKLKLKLVTGSGEARGGRAMARDVSRAA